VTKAKALVMVKVAKVKALAKQKSVAKKAPVVKALAKPKAVAKKLLLGQPLKRILAVGAVIQGQTP